MKLLCQGVIAGGHGGWLGCQGAVGLVDTTGVSLPRFSGLILFGV